MKKCAPVGLVGFETANREIAGLLARRNVRIYGIDAPDDLADRFLAEGIFQASGDDESPWMREIPVFFLDLPEKEKDRWLTENEGKTASGAVFVGIGEKLAEVYRHNCLLGENREYLGWVREEGQGKILSLPETSMRAKLIVYEFTGSLQNTQKPDHS